MTEQDHCDTFMQAVGQGTDCYVTNSHGYTIYVLVPTGMSMDDVFSIADKNGMVCCGVNVLKTDTFDVELRFRHIDESAIITDD